MTVSELVRYLKKLDPEMKIYVGNEEDTVDDQGEEYLSAVRLPFPLIRPVKDAKIVSRPSTKTAGAKKCLIL